ncbi:MAG TPA: UDP-glucose 4-epimerase GalE [Polyangiaceae bacterium]|nr:UDP-glucose 4-epimerase GalE [Polyangiaceae bacterium]
MRILVTGGAGYIGSHMTQLLVERGHDVTVIDDLSGGHRDAVSPGAAFVQASITDAEAVAGACAGADAVIHFAGRIQVGESVTAPRKYFQDNLVASLRLLDAVLDAGVRTFVFSSTAAVYGDPESTPIPESHPTRPVNPYGETKLAFERALASYGRAYGLKWAALRYFNAAGAHGGLRERHDPETHLIPLALAAAKGGGPPLRLFGTDWPTPDGTCIRDYVHVRDLALAHLAAIEHMGRGGEGGPINLGTGRGSSVREVISAVEEATGKKVAVIEGPRRAGDPAVLVASAERARSLLGWSAQTSLRDIVRSAAAYSADHST